MEEGNGSSPKKGISDSLKGIFGAFRKNSGEDEIEEEIISMVREGHEHGVLLASEANMIHNIFTFGDKNAKDIMIHRKQIVGLEGNLTFREALEVMIESSYSRYPVYLEDLNNIIGVLHIKDALGFAMDQEAYDRKLRDFDTLLQTVDFVPETSSLTSLFARMQSKKTHLLIVMDEYGQTSGMLSMEDIIEEIVGNIQDEHDLEEKSIARIAPDYFRMEGSTSLVEAAEVLGIDFPEEYDTLNGFLIHMIDRIPEEHESFEVSYKTCIFKIQDVVGRMIQEVYVFAQ